MKSFLSFLAFTSYILLSFSTSSAHHEEEVYMFLYFAQEPGVLKISTFILGSFLILCGIYISYKASLEVKEVLLNAGHCPHDEIPDRVNEEMIDWLKG